jgi:hypothetical protein
MHYSSQFAKELESDTADEIFKFIFLLYNSQLN